MISSVSSVVRRHPLIAFFALSYAVAWGFLPFGSFGAFGPLVAALVVIPMAQSWAGLRELGSRMIRWRVRWHWYALATGFRSRSSWSASRSARQPPRWPSSVPGTLSSCCSRCV